MYKLSRRGLNSRMKNHLIVNSNHGEDVDSQEGKFCGADCGESFATQHRHAGRIASGTASATYRGKSIFKVDS